MCVCVWICARWIDECVDIYVWIYMCGYMCGYGYDPTCVYGVALDRELAEEVGIENWKRAPALNTDPR
jgi:hypothetical protein